MTVVQGLEGASIELLASIGFYDFKGPRSPLDTVASVRPKVKWVSSVTPRILGVLFSGATTSPIRTWGWN